MPHFERVTTICAYLDHSTKGQLRPGEAEKRRHNTWRVEKYINGQRIRLGRVRATSREDAVAAFSH